MDRLAVGVLRMLPPGLVDAEAELDTIVDLAAVAELVDVAAVLCEVLESDSRPPHPGHLVYADGDLSSARRCLRALAAIDKQDSRMELVFLCWRDWQESIQQWAAQELEAKGQYIPPPGR